ncbi:MAG: hypothetical protein ACRDKI_11175 [Solirubrobacterales bacterium]
MSQGDTKAQLEEAGRRFIKAVPALAPLKLSVRVDLQAKGDHQQYRLDFPGPEVEKDSGAPAMIDVLVMRQDFNDILDPRKGMTQWIEAFDQGKIKISGEGGMVKLVAKVIEKQQRRHGG